MPNYDVIVVGAGPGGATAAKTAADAGLKVLMLERARTPGDKNMSGAVLFRKSTEETFPNFMESPAVKGMPYFTGIGIQALVDNDDKNYGIIINTGVEPFHDMVNVFRPEIDAWIADQAVKAGVELRTATVQDVIIEDDTCRGVVLDHGERIEAPLVIGCDGMHSTVGKKSGLTHFDAEKITLAIKYIYRLPGDRQREIAGITHDVEEDTDKYSWGTDPVQFFGEPVVGASHVVAYPARDLIAITTYEALDQEMKNHSNIHQRQRWYLNTPKIQQWTKDAEFIQFDVHCLAFASPVGYSDTYMNGLMLVGDAAGMAHPVDSWGANAAQKTGRAAGKVAVLAKQRGDYTTKTLCEYEKAWRGTYVGEDEGTGMRMGRWMRDPAIGDMMHALDDVASTAINDKFNDKSYDQIIGEALPKMMPMLPAIVEALPIVRGVLGRGLRKASGLTGMLGGMLDTGEDEDPLDQLIADEKSASLARRH